MPIIDAQVHLWRKGTPTPPHLATPYLVEDAIRGMDEAGVDGAILHPPASWDPDSNEQAVEAVLAYPKRFAILGYPPLDKPDSRSLIATWKQRPGMLGLRLYFNKPHNRSWPMDGTMDWLWPAAEKARIAGGAARGRLAASAWPDRSPPSGVEAGGGSYGRAQGRQRATRHFRT